jgi:hypothetical protein
MTGDPLVAQAVRSVGALRALADANRPADEHGIAAGRHPARELSTAHRRAWDVRSIAGVQGPVGL